MSMLGHDDRERLAEIERHLTADDPAFAARMRAPRRSRLSWPLVLLMAVLWAVVPIAAALAGWPAAVAALTVVAVVEAGRRIVRRPWPPRC
jgi:hypothetical protein